jgi:hypothetical protein
VAGAAVLMLMAGYFGCKLQSLEGVAVVQVAALLLMSVEDMGPTFSGLARLNISLGVTAFTLSSYYYEDSSVPTHLSSVLHTQDPFTLINICLAFLMVPLIVALVFKILSATKYK